MQPQKSTFALYFGNRGVFPPEPIAQARADLQSLLQSWGYQTLVLEESATRYGAVETRAEGERYARFLYENKGKFDGVILSLPNFGDEGGAVTALRDASVPILIQAYPDELDKMIPALRRDAFCGKLSIMDVFNQYGVKFTALKPHVVDPHSPAFRENVDTFDRVCQVVKGLKRMTVGAIGARTTPFKTVRTDELALQAYGITTETVDLSHVIQRVQGVTGDHPKYKRFSRELRASAEWGAVPPDAFDRLVRLGVVMEEIVQEFKLDAYAIRCWNELQEQLRLAPCVVMGVFNDRGIPAACEVDIANAVIMHALQLGSGQPAALLDWNNNYADAAEKCILFHCGPVPRSLMTAPGHVSDNPLLARTLGAGCGFGCNYGRINPGLFTFSSLLTWQGKVKVYLGDGRFTPDPIDPEFFGTAGVAEIRNLEDVLLHVGRGGFRHHVAVTPGVHTAALREALGNYLGFEIQLPQDQSTAR